MEILVKERSGKTKTVEVELTGHENGRDLLNILGLDPARHIVKAGRRILEEDENIPPHERVAVEDSHVDEESEITWRGPSERAHEKLALTLAMHFASTPSQVIGVEVKPEVTPSQLADTLVKRFGGINPHDVTQMVDGRGRNLMEVRHRDRTFGDIGVQAGDTLDIQGDITQGS